MNPPVRNNPKCTELVVAYRRWLLSGELNCRRSFKRRSLDKPTFCNNIQIHAVSKSSSQTLSSVVHTLRGVGGGGTHMKGTGMLIISLRGVNFRFWSCLGCPGKTPLYLAVKVTFRVDLEEIIKNYRFSIRFIYPIHVIKV